MQALRVCYEPTRQQGTPCVTIETVDCVAAQVAPTATTDELGDAAVDLVEQLLEAYFMQVRPSTGRFNFHWTDAAKTVDLRFLWLLEWS
jgi:hypothetical protein